MTKKMLIADLLCKDLDIDSRRLRPGPIYIDWDKACFFTQSIPHERLTRLSHGILLTHSNFTSLF
jgi:hypothetical protein